MIQRYPPDDPREWLNRARSDLALARTERPDVYLEDLCFHAQQAVEKAVKALLIARQVDFPYTHDIAQLLTLLENAGQPLPEPIRGAERLTRFAVFARYPGVGPPVRREEYEEALTIAEAVVHWAEEQIYGGQVDDNG